MNDPHDTSSPTLNPREGDYLWDRQGAPDPQVQQLETLLGGLAHRSGGKAAALPAPARWRGTFPRAAAALLIVSIGAAWLASLWLRGPSPASEESWHVTALEGAPTIGSARISSSGQWRIGQWLSTDGSSQARIDVADIGHVTVDPDSRIRLVQTHESQHRLELTRGRIEAFITAPPRLFLVDTPAATAVDLGCAYDLTIEEDGSGLLRVTMGWVALEGFGVESLVPRHGQCRTKPGHGPGTPFASDARAELRSALDEFDFERGGSAAVEGVLSTARREDSITLWHLLRRVNLPLRERVYDRLAALTPPPASVTRDGVLALDAPMLGAWWELMKWGW